MEKQVDRNERERENISERNLLFWGAYGLNTALLGTLAFIAPKAIEVYTDKNKI